MPTDGVNTWTPHLKISFGGTLGDPPLEVWSNSVRFRVSGSVPTAPQLQSIADACAPSIAAWISRGSSGIRTAVKGTYVKASWIQANGKQRDANTAQHDFSATEAKGSYTGAGLWVSTYCLTFRTDIKRGRGHSGRIYPPMAGVLPAAGDPYVNVGEASNMANSGAVLLTNLDGQIANVLGGAEGVCAPAVFSPGNSLRGTGPISNDIVSVVVDRVPDIMHSRTNRVPRQECPPQPVG
jgi:hypothetical protein